MSIEKTTSVDQITVTENGAIMVREAIRIIENGVELSKTYHRLMLVPGNDISGLPANVQAVCNAAWTPEVVAAHQNQVA
jgi:hypothetical protein